MLASSAPNALAYSVEGVDWCSVDQPAKGVARLRGPAAAEFGVEAEEPVDDGPWQLLCGQVLPVLVVLDRAVADFAIVDGTG